MKNNEYIPKGIIRIYHVIVFALLFTGFAQMPIFKRYYLADVPGFAWTADYYLNHRLHYVLAALLLGFFTYVAVVHFTMRRKRFKLTGSGWTSTAIWLGILVTGIMRVAKNQPDIHFSPTTTMWIDWLHLGLVMLLGAVSLAHVLLGRDMVLRRP